MNNYEKNNRWELVKVTATRTLISLEGHNPYVEINFSFTVKRQAKTHAVYITQSTLGEVWGWLGEVWAGKMRCMVGKVRYIANTVRN